MKRDSDQPISYATNTTVYKTICTHINGSVFIKTLIEWMKQMAKSIEFVMFDF